MGDIQMTFREFYVYVVIGGAVLGALFGLIPLILGRRRNKARLGWYGFIASIVAGGLAPLVAIVVTAIFSWVIVRDNPAETYAATDNSSDVADDPQSE